VCKKLIKNSQSFGKKFQKTVGGDFFDSHCMYSTETDLNLIFAGIFCLVVQALLQDGHLSCSCSMPNKVCFIFVANIILSNLIFEIYSVITLMFILIIQ